ncbi:bifunctional [glutamate--ammonia ligase]-adenylyl-L-tyrosine phosphorylase/[glutamate--ammonia-ligase] adenylyltransferase [Veronia nyctiphanis]|uniref:Bifunctional glutamine synthetase adenylyltransferase/adenylyl-removing enzyme n=1 Tax=Veronia nyctiphanis TaxID=1278244 RepID=A0A4Q0YJF4_9GAMM|nr:bifunctional [glutamate--ammonia ligase]-adenylyl-L-tyrosine phosphorylase/[glutamate--ammonia-ligase] adenylyltransferase [Veronia nyctiphanis]RXJ70515.1 bifunctional [glutamate--ammonia ligase]-adenylyl-L-tyrosine phosphorylase/[glutamate--ammonia-ligase] adenylyltransferase [Veronia nyctiphanis]
MSLPSSLQPLATQATDNLTERQPDNIASWKGDAREALAFSLGMSDFINSAICSDESLLPWLSDALKGVTRRESYRSLLRDTLSQVTDENQFMKILRQHRRREMVWLAWKDIHNDISLEESLIHLSELAEAMIMEAYHWLYVHCCKQWGTPCNDQGDPQPMLVLGMGKLGGQELNFSSDIDLIFTYPENGETQGARRSIANAQFFTRLGQHLIKALDQHTVDGFCYRVDMRLRPFGDSGPLIMSYSAMEDYYQEQGRDWERYAMIKARVMGDEQSESYTALRDMLMPFVFRRYIDFSAIQSLRRMKSMIRSEVRRRGLKDNIKLGPGGIREIEFIAQSLQLVRGGREPGLRHHGLIETLEEIASLGLMPRDEVDTLCVAYRYLRRVENLLQAIDDKQTQTLPDNERDQTRLVAALGEEDWSSFCQKLETHMADVHVIFDQMIGDDEEDDEKAVDAVYHELWSVSRHKDEALAILTDIEAAESESIAGALVHFRTELSKRTLGSRGREVMNHLMPVILSAMLSREDGHIVLPRIGKLLLRIATRTTYLELLDEHPAAISHLVKLCAASPMVAEQLANYPVLLDELLDPQHLYHPTPPEQYKNELFEYLARVPEEDMEQQMEMIRQFKQTQLLRIAAADIAGVLPLMRVSDHLTLLAEAIIQAVVNQAWHQMAEKYGQPTHLAGRDGKGFSVIGYGKLGGLELGYGSDLDVVFLHDCPENIYTDGKKEIDGRQFYLRLAQRVVHLFSTRTASGVLYEIDTRLRPSGASGMLVSTVESFHEYQQKEAWTWEHQALVRTRPVYGDKPLIDAFLAVRDDVLSRVRDTEKLRKEVADMRVKMRDNLGSKNAGKFHIKQDPGGITDIEFLTQYLVLQFGHQSAELYRWSDNIRILEDMEKAGILQSGDAEQLVAAYVTLRDEIHRLNLLDKSVDVDNTLFEDEREVVTRAWQKWMTV